MREIMNVSSTYDAKSRMTIVEVDVGERNCAGTLVHCTTGLGRAKWNENDKFDPNEGFRIAYERALAQIPKENIIEECGGLRDGDWVCIETKKGDCRTWGIVSNGYILYIIGSGNFDRTSTFDSGETLFERVVTVVRPINDYPITRWAILGRGYLAERYHNRCKIYTAN